MLYQVDAREWVRTKSDLTLLTRLIDRLGYEAHSRYRVAVLGDETWWGWDVVTARLADLFDLTLHANSSKKPKPQDLAPRPESPRNKPREVKVTSLEELARAYSSMTN